MFILVAIVLFVISIFVLGTTHSWAFWMLLAFIAFSLHFLLDLPLPGRFARRRVT